jgi:phenylpropionate dioxygenase-like ring-hydroxylating dioxygenase large terminal subunit
MSEDLAVSIHGRVLSALQTQRGDADAAEGSVDVDRYLSASVFAEEQLLFRRCPQPVAAASSLPRPGCWLSLTFMGVPLLLVRQESGEVQAFLNVCRHRGARVVPEGQGEGARSFVCPYHAWSYRLDGTLRGVPQAFGFPDLKQEDSGLRKLATVQRAGVVWVILELAKAQQDLNESLGELMDGLESLQGLRDPAGYAQRSYEVEANWKLIVDGYFEAYHFRVAHQATIAHMFLDNMQIVDEFGLNRRLFLCKSTLAREQPAIEDFNPRRHGNIIHFFFPNTIFLVQPDHAQLSWLEPLDAGRTRLHEITLIPQAPDSDKAKQHWDANVELYRRTLAEDYVLAESIQAGLASGANRVLRFGTFEFSAPRFHAQLEQQVALL